MEMHTDVPHAGLGYQFLGSKTNSRLKAIAFGRSHRKAVGGQRLRLEAVASRWYRLDKPTKVTNSRLRPRPSLFWLEAIARPLGANT